MRGFIRNKLWIYVPFVVMGWKIQATMQPTQIERLIKGSTSHICVSEATFLPSRFLYQKLEAEQIEIEQQLGRAVKVKSVETLPGTLCAIIEAAPSYRDHCEGEPNHHTNSPTHRGSHR